MFAWLPAQHLRPVGLGAVQTPGWFSSGCAGSSARARWVSGGYIEIEGQGVLQPTLPAAVDQWTSTIRSAASEHGVPPQLVAGIMATESNGQQGAKSWCCYGLMGFLPATASWVAGRTVTPAELLSNPTLNVRLGAKLIRTLLDKYKGDVVKTTLAYNAGSVKCGTPGKCPDGPNQWRAITDCAQGKAVDYPARMIGYSNAWQKKHGAAVGMDFLGPNFRLEVALKTTMLLGLGYVAYRTLR